MRAILAVAVVALLASPAPAERIFGSVSAGCDSFGECSLTLQIPEHPAISADVYFQRTGKADAPVTMTIRVNKPVEGGVAVKLEIGSETFDLVPGSDVLTHREMYQSREILMGYDIAPARVPQLLGAMRRARDARLTVPVEGERQNLVVALDGLDDALRFVDSWQGRGGAQDALIEKGSRAPADTAVPKPLSPRETWPEQIGAILKREKCELDDNIATFESLNDGFVATPLPGRTLWQIPCWGSNYNILFVLIEMRDGDPETARLLRFPTRLHKRQASVVVNPNWWDARKELWEFERGRSHGGCGTIVRYRWTPAGFTLIDQRRKDDCDGKRTDPWTTWPVARAKPRRKA